jgi:phosphatidylglycerophosphatase A
MISSEFMLNLHKELIDNKKVSDSSAGLYIRSLYVLNDKKPFKNLNFIKNTEKVVKQITDDYAESTQKSLYAVLTSILSLYKDKPTYKRVYEFYKDKMDAKSEVASKQDSAQKTQKQEENWIVWDEVVKHSEELRQKCEGFVNQKTITARQFDTLLQYVVLSLYTYVPPRRNLDYLDCMVNRVSKTFKSESLPVESNHIVIAGGVPTKFVFNKYKTVKTYGQQSIAIPEGLGQAILWYVKHHPLGKNKSVKSFKFLVGYDGKELVAGNTITRILNKIFGKAVGSSMLRHIYLSSKFNVTEMEETAAEMGHSMEEQRKYLKRPSETQPQSQSLGHTQAPVAPPQPQPQPQPQPALEAHSSPQPPAQQKKSRPKKRGKTDESTD